MIADLHTLESLERNEGGEAVATCSCHNPDGEGEGRADFRDADAVAAYNAWKEHADTENAKRGLAG